MELRRIHTFSNPFLGSLYSAINIHLQKKLTYYGITGLELKEEANHFWHFLRILEHAAQFSGLPRKFCVYMPKNGANSYFRNTNLIKNTIPSPTFYVQFWYRLVNEILKNNLKTVRVNFRGTCRHLSKLVPFSPAAAHKIMSGREFSNFQPPRIAHAAHYKNFQNLLFRVSNG